MPAETTIWPHVDIQKTCLLLRHLHICLHSFRRPRKPTAFDPVPPCLCHGWPNPRTGNVTQPKVAEDSNCSGAMAMAMPPHAFRGKCFCQIRDYERNTTLHTSYFLMVLVKLARLSATMKPPMSDEPATSLIFFAILLCNSDIAHMHSPMLPPLAKHNFSLIEPPWPGHHSIWKIAVSFNG